MAQDTFRQLDPDRSHAQEMGHRFTVTRKLCPDFTPSPHVEPSSCHGVERRPRVSLVSTAAPLAAINPRVDSIYFRNHQQPWKGMSC